MQFRDALLIPQRRALLDVLMLSHEVGLLTLEPREQGRRADEVMRPQARVILNQAITTSTLSMPEIKPRPAPWPAIPAASTAKFYDVPGGHLESLPLQHSFPLWAEAPLPWHTIPGITQVSSFPWTRGGRVAQAGPIRYPLLRICISSAQTLRLHGVNLTEGRGETVP